MIRQREPAQWTRPLLLRAVSGRFSGLCLAVRGGSVLYPRNVAPQTKAL